jgi:hypothetical protein
MNFLAQLRHRLSDILHHHAILHEDPLLGAMEEFSPAQWRTTMPVEFLPGMEPIHVTLEADADGSDATGRATFLELRERYAELQRSICPMICKVTTREHPASLWHHAVLAGVDIWHGPEGEAVIALQYLLDHDPEYTYVVRVEQWRPLDVLITG